MLELMWLAIAFLCGLIAHRFGVPIFVGYIAAGFVVAGATGQGVTARVEELSHLGVILLLFTVGLHLRFRSVLSAPVLVGGSVHLIISALLFLVVMPLLGWPVEQAVFLGLVLAFSSTVLAAKDLEVRNELGAYHGRVAIGILLLQDIAAIGILIYLDQESNLNNLWVVLAVIPVAILIRPVLSRLVAHVHDEDLMLIMSLLLAMGGAAFTEWAHIGGEVGALLIGALLADHARSHEMRRRLWDLKEFFLVAFFFLVGVKSFPPSGAWLEVIGFSTLILLILPFKAGLFFGLLTLLGLRARTAFLTGAALTSYSEFTLLAGMLALNAGLITATQFSILGLVTAASFAINLPINRLINRIYSRYEHTLTRLERHNLPHPDDQATHFGRTTHLIFGMGRTGRAAYDYLTENGYRPLGLDVDPVKIQRNLDAKRRVLYGDVQDPEFWLSSNLDGLKGIIVAVPSFDARIEAIRRTSNSQTPISTFALNDKEMVKLLEAGPANISHILTDAGIRIAAALTD